VNVVCTLPVIPAIPSAPPLNAPNVFLKSLLSSTVQSISQRLGPDVPAFKPVPVVLSAVDILEHMMGSERADCSTSDESI
jgi:hypothetical protein